jgi:hypothetical protein
MNRAVGETLLLYTRSSQMRNAMRTDHGQCLHHISVSIATSAALTVVSDYGIRTASLRPGTHSWYELEAPRAPRPIGLCSE